MSVKVEPNQFFHSDGVWEPDEKQLKYIEKILSPLPFDTTVYILISGAFGDAYTLKPKDTLILKPEHVKRKDVIIHEFGHHIWHELLDSAQQWAWREFIDVRCKNAFKRNNRKDIYNEYLAHTAEYTWGQSAKRVKDKEKAELLKNFLLIQIFKKTTGASYMELTKELKKRGYKKLASKIKAYFIKAEEGEEQPPTIQPQPEDPTVKLQEAIIQLLKGNPSPSDEDIHNLAMQLKVEPDVLEEAVYKLLASLINGVGKHADISDDKYDPKQLEMGIEVEHEHTDNDAIAKNIAKDHLSEPSLSSNYYTLLLEMEKKAKEQTGKNNEMSNL